MPAVALLGPTARALQAPGLVAGLLMLPFLYAWGRRAFGRRFALLATALLAVSGWQLLLSRGGSPAALIALFTTVGCAALVRANTTRRHRDFAAAGVALALALATFGLVWIGDGFGAGARPDVLVELPAAVFFALGVLWAVLAHRDPRARFLLAGLAVALLPALAGGPDLDRAPAALPFFHLLAALGVVFAGRELTSPGARAGLAVAAVVAGACATYIAYLAPNPRNASSFDTPATVLGEAAQGVSTGAGLPLPAAPTARAAITRSTAGLRQPRGVAVAPDGGVVVAEFAGHRVQVLDERLGAVRGWGARGSAAGRFNQPGAVAVGPHGRVLVADTWNHRVQVFTSDGRFRGQWRPGLYGPRGIAVDSRGRVFVVDTGNSRVLRFDARGKLQRAWGGRGSGPGQLDGPVGIATDGARVVVADNGNARVVVFSTDGRPLSHFPVPGLRDAAYSEPNVAFGLRGEIWVTVPIEREIRAYNRSGRLLRRVTATSFAGGSLGMPMGIAFDERRGELVVSELEGRVVRIRLRR